MGIYRRVYFISILHFICKMSKRGYKESIALEEGFSALTLSTTVKQGLAGILRDDLSEEVREIFFFFLDQSTKLVARLTRRTSIIVLYIITRALEDGLDIPDFEELPARYFNQLLRIGLKQFKSVNPLEGPFLVYFNEIVSWIDVDINIAERGQKDKWLPWGLQVPGNITQILDYAAQDLKKNLVLHYKLHFWDIMGRCCKVMAEKNAATKFDLYNSILKDIPNERCSEAQVEFVRRMRGAFNMDEKLSEDTHINVPDRARVMWAMQEYFADKGARKISMAPLFSVQRPHVHLDMNNLASVVAMIDKESGFVSANTLMVRNKKNNIADPAKALATKYPFDKKPRRPAGMPLADWKRIQEEYKTNCNQVSEKRRQESQTEEYQNKGMLIVMIK